jgi:peptidoglycan pentaglycine glycine transferase (the first glycine)
MNVFPVATRRRFVIIGPIMAYAPRPIDDRDEWDSIIRSFPEYSITHSYDWGELKGAFGWRPFRAAVFDGDTAVGAVQVLARRIPVLGGSLLYAPRGFLCDYTNADIVEALISVVGEFAREAGAVMLKVEPMVPAGGDVSALDGLGFKPTHKGVQPKTTLALDLNKPEDELLAGMHRRTRYNARLALRKGVEITDGNDAEHLESFYRMLEETSERKHFLVHNRDYYDRILELFGPTGRIFLARYDGTVISGAFILRFGKYAYYSYGASRREHAKTKSTQAVQWAAIRWAKENGCEVYDFWGVPEDPDPDHPLYGVYKFKTGFGGYLVKYVGAFDLPLRSFEYRLVSAALEIQSMWRNIIARGTVIDPMGN